VADEAVFLKAEEVADYLRVSRATIWRWCNEGRLPAFQIGREWRINKVELDRLIAQSGSLPRASDG
jgi:excisionase family DNA binding protein